MNEYKGMFFGLLGVFFFGLTLPITKIILPYFNPVFIGLGRAALAALPAAGLLYLYRQKIPSTSQFRLLAVVAAGVVFGFPILSAVAMGTVPASHGGAMLGIMPLLTAAISAVFNHERPSLGFWLTGIAGAIIIGVFTLSKSVDGIQSGDFILLAAALSASVGYAVGGRLAKEIGGWQVICWALVIAFPFTTLVSVMIAEPSYWSAPSFSWVGFLYLALFSQLFGFFFWNKGLAIGGVAKVSQIMLFQPFITIIASSFLAAEAIEARTIFFALLVVGCVAISKKMPVNQLHR